jgi:hypothetical protein
VARKGRKARKKRRPSRGRADGARGIPSAPTKPESMERDFELSAFRDEVIEGVRRLAGSRSLRDIVRDDRT